MTKNYTDITRSISDGMAKLREATQEVMKGFGMMAMGAKKAGALDEKTKELIALGIGIANHCDGCIGFHTKTLVKLGTTREEFIEMLSVAMYMGGGPSVMYASEALQAFEEFSNSN